MEVIGFIGLGHMGGNMAARLLAAGHRVYGTSRHRDHAQSSIDAGLCWRDSAGDVTRAADIVFTSLPDDDALELVAEAILPALDANTTWVDVSTVSPALARELASRVRLQGAAMLDAPVSGSVPQVRAGALTIMVGGSHAAYARVEPVLRRLGAPTHVGGHGHGQVLKLAINISLAAQTLAFAEGLRLATRGGVRSEVALDVMTSSAIGSPALRARAPLMLDPPDEAWFDIGLMRKDIELAQATARELGITLPATASADGVLRVAGRLGYDRHDLASLFQVLEQLPQPFVAIT